MPGFGVNTAIIQDQKILLTKRVDFEVWCLPGGGVEEGESLAEAARRETIEEVGLEVRLTRLVGLYSRNGWLNGGLHVAVFAAEITGGDLCLQASEVLEAHFFAASELPSEMLLSHRRRCLDALNGVQGAVWFSDSEWAYPPQTTRQDLYDLCQQSGLSKSEYYLRYVGKPGPRGDVLEVEGLLKR